MNGATPKRGNIWAIRQRRDNVIGARFITNIVLLVDSHMNMDHIYVDHIYIYMQVRIEPSLIKKRIINDSDRSVSSIHYQL